MSKVFPNAMLVVHLCNCCIEIILDDYDLNSIHELRVEYQGPEKAEIEGVPATMKRGILSS